MDAKLNRQLFNYCESRLYGECVSFWNAVEQYRCLDSLDKRRVVAQRIWLQHCDPSAELEVNLSSTQRRDIERDLSSATNTLFDEAQTQVYMLMQV